MEASPFVVLYAPAKKQVERMRGEVCPRIFCRVLEFSFLGFSKSNERKK